MHAPRCMRLEGGADAHAVGWGRGQGRVDCQVCSSRCGIVGVSALSIVVNIRVGATPIMKRPAAADICPGVALYDASQYTELVHTYANRGECFADLGCGLHCQGHAARVVKKNGQVTHLRCRLRTSSPPCSWAAILCEARDGSVELLRLPHGMHANHNSHSQSQGVHGWADLSERKAVADKLLATATARPTRALREARLAKTPVVNVQLKQVQRLKQQVVRSQYGCRTVGQLREAVAKRQRVPAAACRTQGFFCFSSIRAKGKQLQFTVVATTRKLQSRWVNCTHCVAAIDGGFKFNLLGWPLHVLGHVNAAGRFGLCALGLTSSMDGAQIRAMLKGFRDSTVQVTQGDTTKRLAMSDAETAYRRAMAEVFRASNLMCFFHVKQAAKEYLRKHLSRTKKECDAIWAGVSADIDLIRAAHTTEDWKSRLGAVKEKWAAEGIDEQTHWVDPKGVDHNCVAYFDQQWGAQCPEWYVGASKGAVAPSTNNGAESCIKNTRFDVGNVVGSVGETVAFLLSQVEAVSRTDYDPDEPRDIERALWHRAAAFSTLFKTDKVRPVPVDGQTYYCCAPRAVVEDVCDRPVLSGKRAAALVQAFARQRVGGVTSADQLCQFVGPSGARVFGIGSAGPFCSCLAFSHPRHCLHTLALDVYMGRRELPPWTDDVPLAMAAKGNKPKAPGRGAVPIKVDEKDRLISRLQAQVCKLTKQLTPSCDTQKRRRLVGKTADSTNAQPESPSTRSAREQSNAAALVANLEVLATDPSIGMESCPRPVGQPRLPAGGPALLVPATGKCLALCCVAASRSEEWAVVPRRPDGTPVVLARLVEEDIVANSFLLSKVGPAGIGPERVGELVMGQYAEAKDLPYFAAAVGGAIGVQGPLEDAWVQGMRYFGSGPLVMIVELYYLVGKSAPHYKLLQSWL